VPLRWDTNSFRRTTRPAANGTAPWPTLREIATMTGGKFFRVADTDTIESAFKAIDRAQKIEFQAKSYLITTELFWWLAAPGLSALALAALFARPLWRRGLKPVLA